MRRPLQAQIKGRRPPTAAAEHQCLSAYVTVHGLKVLALFDSGSTSESVTPDVARVAKLLLIELENPATLQLGCIGSKSKINHGAEVRVDFDTISDVQYLDIVNIDRYDMIIGTPFMYKHGISLDFEHRVIRIRGRPVPALSAGEEAAAINNKIKPRVNNAKTKKM
ncbi:hypothetical protein DENSPDRAFT_773163 [Dentipellis sp. KUC8613]|nr:hypothetical protein DENSPDRAFT_773163 [Dentipellis sp. KUC8613]